MNAPAPRWWREDPGQPGPAVPAKTRLLIALGIGALSGLFCALAATRPGAAPDLLYPLTAARLFLSGASPYQVMSDHAGAAPPFDQPLYFPFTSVLAVIPLATLRLPLACGLFFGVSSALLAFFCTRRELWRLHLFASAPFVVAAILGQFAPLVMVMAFVPAAGFLGAFKPNIGVALLARRPAISSLLGFAAVGGLSLLLQPSWPRDWLAAVNRLGAPTTVHEIPILQMIGVIPIGLVLLLALKAWRQPAGRLLIAMSVLPQLLFFYDQLLLWLIPRTRRQSILLTASSQLAFVLWYVLREPGESLVRSAYPYVMALLYLPALAILLRSSPDSAPVAERNGQS